MEDSYKTVLAYGSDEFIVNKSRFIGYAKPIDSEEEALDFIEEIKEKHRDATHNVSAYVFGESSNIQRFNDDGEPSGTAGIPALEVLKKENLKNVVLVVTRYFGGVKLGGGGLIRAYTKGAKIGLEAAKIVDMVVHRELKIKVDYTAYGKIENYLLSNDYTTDDIVFDDAVNISIRIKYSDLDKFIQDIVDFTSGEAEISQLDKVHLPVENGKTIYI